MEILLPIQMPISLPNRPMKRSVFKVFLFFKYSSYWRFSSFSNWNVRTYKSDGIRKFYLHNVEGESTSFTERNRSEFRWRLLE